MLEVEGDAAVVDLERADARDDGGSLGLRATLRARRHKGADVDADGLAGGARGAGLGVEQLPRAAIAGLEALVELGRGEGALRQTQGLARAARRQVRQASSSSWTITSGESR